MVSKLFSSTRTLLFSILILSSNSSAQLVQRPESEISCSSNSDLTSLSKEAWQLPEIAHYIPMRLGKNMALFHNDKGDFFVKKDGHKHLVNVNDIDEELRALSNDELAFLLGLKAKIEIDGVEQILVMISPELTSKLIAEDQDFVQFSPEDSEKIISQLPASSFIKVSQYSNGDYKLQLKTRLPGAGAGGAACGFYIGIFIAHAIGGAISGTAGLGATLVAGPIVGASVAAGVWGCLQPTVTAAAVTMAMVGGVTVGVVTGPV